MPATTVLHEAARALSRAEALLVTAGAGMGVDSGLPDFRGREGFWRAYPPIARLGLSFQEMANPRWFEADPALAWAFYGHRLHLYRTTMPHFGYRQVLKMGRTKPGGVFVFTSNVDGQFQKAGFAPERIEECHGSIHHLQCAGPCHDAVWSADQVRVEVDMETFQAREPLPRCPRCGALARPNILMFGDWAWLGGRSDAQGRRLAHWLEEVERASLRLTVLEFGAGHAVPTVRRMSETAALRLDATLIRINPRDFEVPAGEHISLPMGAAAAMTALAELGT